MRTAVLLSLLVLSTSAVAAAAEGSGLQYFYCIHGEKPCEETTAPVLVASGNATAVAKRALSTPENFVGFVDASETTLQFFVEADDSILVDMPVPDKQGSYSTHLDRAHALKLIAHLAPPLVHYRSELKLVFAKWD